jgi:hypothetical protein
MQRVWLRVRVGASCWTRARALAYIYATRVLRKCTHACASAPIDFCLCVVALRMRVCTSYRLERARARGRKGGRASKCVCARVCARVYVGKKLQKWEKDRRCKLSFASRTPCHVRASVRCNTKRSSLPPSLPLTLSPSLTAPANSCPSPSRCPCSSFSGISLFLGPSEVLIT